MCGIAIISMLHGYSIQRLASSQQYRGFLFSMLILQTDCDVSAQVIMHGTENAGHTAHTCGAYCTAL